MSDNTKLNVLQFYTIPEGDWEALYVNGELQVEGHKVRVEEVAQFTPIESVGLKYIENFDEDYFPDRVEDFPNHWRITSYYD